MDTVNLEPKRDWHIGPITGHRMTVVLAMIITTLTIYRIQGTIWHGAGKPVELFPVIWNWGALLWLGAVIPGALGLVGMLMYKHPNNLDDVKPITQLVSWRIVSRGTNVETLISTIRRCQSEMAKTPLFPYVIEVVTDSVALPALDNDSDVVRLIVPPDYQTKNGSLYKARGLQYALKASNLPDDAWIVHLDEETQPTSSVIKGIARMIAEEEATGKPPRIGQGALLYGRNWKKHPFMTLADMVRTGDDFARFHLGHRLGVTLFGMHGSYIVVKNWVEKNTGFDFGPQGSITEDAFWALISMQAGYRCRWVEGYLEEQSTESLKDFVKQRRRWYQGLSKVALHAPVAKKWRLVIGMNTLVWTMAPFAVLYTIAHIFYGFAIPFPIKLMADISLASFVTLYITGLRNNLKEHGVTNPFKRLGWYALQIVLMPVLTVLESAGVAYALIKPMRMKTILNGNGFHVVKK